VDISLKSGTSIIALGIPMTQPIGTKRKHRKLQQRQGNTKPSRLDPALANVNKNTVSSHSVVKGSDNGSIAAVTGKVTEKIPTTPATNTVSTITAGANDQFNAFRLDEKSSLESYKNTMEYKLKDDIFRKMKFITNDAMMEFSMDPHSLCQYICSEMHISGGQQGLFWTTTKDTVKRMIEKQRTNATSGCKRAFQGK
jgi:hypothetical protein